LLHAVAGGADDLDFGLMAGGAEGIEDVVRLPECELGAAGADSDGATAWIVHDFLRIRDEGKRTKAGLSRSAFV
jgi:hypothetical protein